MTLFTIFINICNIYLYECDINNVHYKYILKVYCIKNN